jgi:hypothetical protein
MARRHGRCPRGERLRAGVPHGHWKTTTFVAGLTTRGMIAPWVLDGPINRDAFETFVGRVLVQTLMPGDVVKMDNLSSHKGPRVREMIEVAGAELRYLPPYSPDFNPIENASPGSRLCCARRPSAPSTASGPSSAASSTSSPQPSAETTSPTPATTQHDRAALKSQHGTRPSEYDGNRVHPPDFEGHRADPAVDAARLPHNPRPTHSTTPFPHH